MFLAVSYWNPDRSDAVPTMCRRWIDKYHKQAEEQGVAVSDDFELRLEII